MDYGLSHYHVQEKWIGLFVGNYGKCPKISNTLFSTILA